MLVGFRSVVLMSQDCLATVSSSSTVPRPLRECLCGCLRLEQVDLTSRDGFMTRRWGPTVHGFIHTTSWNWDHSTAAIEQVSDGHAAMVDVLECFLVLLYCLFCREHYNEYAASNPPGQVAAGQLHVWSWHLHNAINARQGKLSFPMVLYERAYVHTCEAEAWAKGDVSVRWLFWFWTILYLVGLNHPPHLQRFEPRHLHIQVATDRMLHAMARVIPLQAVRFRRAFARALATLERRWSLYFAWLRCELGVELARVLPAHACISFHTRERAFHFIHELELETIRSFSNHPKAAAAPIVSVFGDTCLDIITYFESTYRVRPH
jgi:hypothetical protein